MRRIARLGSVGGLGGAVVAVALVAHLWMFPSLGLPSPGAQDAHGTHGIQSLHTAVPGAATTVTDGPLSTAPCASGMSACVAAPAEEARLLLAVAISTLPILLWALRDRRSHSRPRTRSCDDDRAPPLSPVTARVLLLE